MDREAAEKALIKLARQSAPTWARVRGETFRGVTILETSNTTYRFEDGVFSGRAARHVVSSLPAWESPVTLAGLELIGFLFEENRLWSLSPRWRAGSLAVIWRLGAMTDEAFMLTSQTVACTITSAPRAAPKSGRPSSYPIGPIEPVGRIPAAAPSVRRPAPPSMTRLRPVPSR